MPKELTEKKLEQMKTIINKLEKLLYTSLDEFLKDQFIVDATERNFQL